MYCIPTKFFEIRNGKIHEDKSLAKKMDKLNGIYIPSNQQMDKDGNCCKVIPKPGVKRRAKKQ